MPGRYWDAIVEVAVDHGGYVTPSLVAPAGVPAVELRKMVSRGTLESAGHGIYRVPVLPIERYDEFIRAGLWAAGRGVISHDSALLVHDLCDINPTKIHLTIPVGYRITRKGGDSYVVHVADLAASDVTRRDAVAVTTVRRTLDDAVDHVAGYLLRQAIATARSTGTISANDEARLLDRSTRTRTR